MINFVNYYKELRRQGIEPQYYRFCIRPRILKTLPVACDPGAVDEVHIQVCKRDYLNAFWSIKTLSFYTGKKFKLFLHTDNSITKEQLSVLNNHFPGIHNVQKDEIREKLYNELGKYKTLVKLWESGSYFTLSRVVDTWLANINKFIIVIEPDVLFFNNPVELFNDEDRSRDIIGRVNVLRDNKVTKGMYCMDDKKIKKIFGITLPIKFGSGLGWLKRSLFDWELIEAVLNKIEIDYENRFLLDQTLLGILAARYGFSGLPVDKYVIEPIENLNGVTARHYYGKTRFLLYKEGIKYLYQNNFLSNFDTCQSNNN